AENIEARNRAVDTVPAAHTTEAYTATDRAHTDLLAEYRAFDNYRDCNSYNCRFAVSGNSHRYILHPGISGGEGVSGFHSRMDGAEYCGMLYASLIEARDMFHSVLVKNSVETR